MKPSPAPNPKLCVNCLHCRMDPVDFKLTYRCKKTAKLNIITGYLDLDACDLTRYTPIKCGLEGKWWEQKPNEWEPIVCSTRYPS